MTTRIGQALREARAARGVELSEAERVTKIRVKFLRAMEEDRWEDLPEPVYVRGFLATYAQFLGLDDAPLVEEYRRSVEGAREPGPIPQGVVRRGTLPGRRAPTPRGVLIAGLVALVAVGLVVAVAVGGSGDGGSPEGGKDRKEKAARTETEPSPTSPSDQTATSPSGTPAAGSEVSLELRSTADVWVCLIDSEGTHIVNGETLPPDETRGPFEGEGFEMTFGNGSVEMTVNGEPVSVPALAEPLGYRVVPEGTKRLPSSAQPDCL
jgi:cytoskeleton protein RodZ